MQANEFFATANPDMRQRPRQIASWGRLVGFLLIVAVLCAGGMALQHSSSGASTGQFASHGKAIPIYLNLIVMEWALLFFCWRAVRGRGGNLQTLSGGRWTSWKGVVVDMGIALPVWLLLLAADNGLSRLLGASSAKTVDSLLPHSLLEVLLWIAVSISAGVCEEMAFRGFLQRQLHALTGSIVVAVLLQGLVFGLGHAYEGWKAVVTICVMGVVFGALAARRGNLRVNIIAHAWQDVWAGWLQSVLWR